MASTKEWPYREINLRLITGAMEVGVDLYLLGNFGGFGGNLFEVHNSKESAEKAAAAYIVKSNMLHHCSVFKLSVKMENEMLEVYDGKSQS